jgi:large subunit ribosomal protein L3
MLMDLKRACLHVILQRRSRIGQLQLKVTKMPNVRQPRSGSMQFWPRKRAERPYARIRHSPAIKDKGLTAFAGYKVGMTHMQAIETRKTSHKKGEEISIPVTILECPSIKIYSIRLYKKTLAGLKLVKEIAQQHKDLSRKLKVGKETKKHDFSVLNSIVYDDVKVVVSTQPRLASTERKKPEIFELSLGGNKEEKLAYAKEHFDKEIPLESVLKEGEYVDLKAITIGKGFQGPVKRFGISLRQSKSEKSIRNPGSLGPWMGQGHIMYRVAHAGKMGYHMRTEYNKQIMKIIKEGKSITPKGGFLRYGITKAQLLLIKGSVAGPRKRLVILQKASRLLKPHELPTVQEINVSEKQGN